MYKKRDELKKQLEDRKLQEECTFKPTLMTKKPEKASSQVIETIPEVDEKDKKNSRFKDLFNLDLPPVDEKVQNQSKKNTPDFDQRSLSFGNKQGSNVMQQEQPQLNVGAGEMFDQDSQVMSGRKSKRERIESRLGNSPGARKDKNQQSIEINNE